MLRSIGLAGITTLVLLSTPASALDITANDPGGRIDLYAQRLALAEARGEQVRIGAVECDSSCTLFLAARRSCVSPNAVFGFHAPWIGEPTGGPVDPRLTAMFASSYKPGLRRLFLAHVRNSGGVAPGPLLKVSGAQLASMGYRLCGGEGYQQTAANRVRRTYRNNGVAINPSAMASSPRFFPFAW
jgi:hypothetical protein